MFIIDRLLTTLAPYDCLGCQREGKLICDDCLAGLPPIVSRCFRCARLTDDFTTCRGCRSSSAVRRVAVATIYDGLAREAIQQLKFNGAQAVAGQMAQQMSRLARYPSPMLVVPTVSATGRVRQRGYDQTKCIARELSRQTGHRLCQVLARSGQARQVGAHRQQRLHQLQGAFRVTKPSRVAGRHILLVDDVVTTGATLNAAARALRAAGAKTVDAIVFAQA